MPIIAVSVEADGWILRLDVTAAPGTFAAYSLDPDGAARVALTSGHAGFAVSGGQAVAATLARAITGTRPLRVAAEVVGSVLQPYRIDETDLGGGVIRVRIALSEHVYATDTNVRLAVAAGWRSGEAAASDIAVTNNSTIAAPIPIMRWALPQLSVASGVFRLSLVAFSHHPNGFQPVAGVRFTVTDGTTTKTAWTTALATDNSLGDNLRCYTVDIDPAMATALTAGLLRCDAEVYPWLGAMRSTDGAGTRSMASLRADAVSVNAATPFVVGHDPAGSRYNAMFAYVDPVNGTATAAAGMVQTTLAGAKAVAAASRPKDINTAVQAGYLFNRTLAGANGQAAITRSIDGMQIVLAPGTHPDGAGSTAVTFGVNSPEIPVRVVGDPDDANPRANCILQVAASRDLQRATRWRFQRFTWEIGGAPMGGTIVQHLLIDDCIVRGRAGFETDASVAPFGGTVVAGTWSFAMTRSRWWRTGVTVSQANARLGLLRACEHSRTVSVSQCALKNRVIPPSEDSTLPAIRTTVAYTGWFSPTLAGQAEDIIVAYNDIRSWGGRAWLPSVLPAATAGTLADSIRRHAFVGNICERVGSDPGPLYSLGETTLVTMSYNIIEGNTFVGERSNTFYSDPPATTMTLVNNALNFAFVNRVAGNMFDWLPTKHDDFNNPVAAATRVAAGLPNHGYRPQMLSAWSMLYGVLHEGNVDCSRGTGAGNFQLQYSGARSLTGYAGSLAPAFASDRSKLGTGAGGGDYRPTATSPALGRVVRGQCDVDFADIARPVVADAGAFQAAITALVPAGTRSGTSAQSPSLALTIGLVPTAARSDHRAAPTFSAWSAVLTPANNLLPHWMQPATLGWHVMIAAAKAVSDQHVTASGVALALHLAPAAARLGLVATGSTLTPDSLLTITPANARHGETAVATLLLPAPSSVGATVIIARDPRSLSPNRN